MAGDSTNPGLSGDDSLADSVKNQLCGAVQVQLLQDVAAVGFHGVNTQIQQDGYLLVTLAFRQKLQNLPLAGREQFVGILHAPLLQHTDVVLHQHLADCGTEKGLAFRNNLHGANQVGLGGVLEEVASRASLEGSHQVTFVVVHTQDDDGGPRVLVDNLAGCLYAVQNGHADVHDYHVWIERRGELCGLSSVASFAHHFEVGLAFQQESQPTPHHRVIVGQQNPNFLHEFFPGKVAFSNLKGSSIFRRVPRPGSDATWNVPCRWLTRSAMPVSPRPRTRRASNPLPSSCIVTSIRSGSWRTTIRTFCAWAWRVQLCRASWMTR